MEGGNVERGWSNQSLTSVLPLTRGILSSFRQWNFYESCILAAAAPSSSCALHGNQIYYIIMHKVTTMYAGATSPKESIIYGSPTVC